MILFPCFLSLQTGLIQGQSDPGLLRGPGDDCGQPAQIINAFSVNLPPSGEATVQACAFGRYGCDFAGGFRYSFSADPADTLMTVTCDDLGQVAVFIHSWDVADNYAIVETFLVVQDFLSICPDGQGALCSPVVQIVNGLNLALPGTGTATLSARQFDWGTYLVDCSPGLGFTFSFSADPADSLRTFSCENDLGALPVEIWVTTDGGQQASAESFIIIQAPLADPDCSAVPPCTPQLIAINGVFIQLSAAHEVSLSPDLFVKNYSEICSGGAFSFSFSEDVQDTQITLGCNDLGQYPIEIWATDELGNQNYLETFVVLQDVEGVCDNPITIAFSPNDQACDADAADLTPYIGAGPVCYNNIDATVQSGEAAPPDGDCFAQDAWCDGGVAHNSVWFTVDAPPSGVLKIDTDGVLDMQLAVWQAASCNDLLSGAAQLTGANDHRPGDPHGNASLTASLSPGEKYYVQADGHGIAETGLFYLTLTELTGTVEKKPGLEFAVFPNPSKGSFSLQLPGPLPQEGQLTIFNAVGIRVAQERLAAGATGRQIDIRGLAAGIYICQISIGQELAGVKRIVVF